MKVREIFNNSLFNKGNLMHIICVKHSLLKNGLIKFATCWYSMFVQNPTTSSRYLPSVRASSAFIFGRGT